MTAVEKLNLAFAEMHREGARRSCASSFILSATYKVNGFDARLSIIAAIGSMGGEHAPVIRTQLLLQQVLSNFKDIQNIVKGYSKMNRIPGFGSGFIKGEPDPIHAEIDALIRQLSPKTHYWMVALMEEVHAHISDKLFFNTAMYSAAYAILQNIEPYVLPGLVIEARMPVWNQIMMGTLNEVRAAKAAKQSS